MRPGLPAIVKLAERLLLEIEVAVSRFSHAHRYTMGSDLRSQMYQILMLANRAWREPARRTVRLEQLSREIDLFKLRLQIARNINACSSARQWEMIVRLAAQLGRQCGGWQREHRRMEQNASAPQASAQRLPILSTRAASSNEASL